MEDSYGFTIYDAAVKVTETEDKIAYSILIKVIQLLLVTILKI
jgi:hypothetical protein